MDLDLMNLEIRTARVDDKGPIAELMYSSSPPLYDYLYREQAMDFVRYQFAAGLGMAGWPSLTVAVVDGQVVGTGCFYDLAQIKKLGPEMHRGVLEYFGESGASAILERSAPMRAALTPPREGELFLIHFGVTPELRSHGIGSKMMQHKIAEARAAGYTWLGLDVAKTNPRGEALYRWLGFQVTTEHESPFAAAGVPGWRKMELVL